MAKVWVSKRGSEEGWDRALFTCCGAAGRGLLAWTESADALRHENGHVHSKA